MVFIVKIPNHNRSRGNMPDPSAGDTAETPSLNEQGKVHPQPRDAAIAPSSATDRSIVRATSLFTPSAQIRHRAASAAPRPAALDILLAPAVLGHRYVRGVDKSLIVERPERVRAVLLGIAGAIGNQPEPAHDDLSATAAPVTIGSGVDGADDLVAQLSSLSVGGNDALPSGSRPPFRVLHSTRSLALDPPHPSVDFVHAHSEELVEVLESAYCDAKRKRQHARQTKIGFHGDGDPTITSSTFDSASSPHPRAAPPTPTSYSAYVHHLSSRAPSELPLSQAAEAAAREQRAARASNSDAASLSSKATSAAESEDYTSSEGEGEGDEAMHPSEIPEHLPQGDLYLAGATDDKDNGGSSQAIRHAVGACAEAVDRVVAAARSEKDRDGTRPAAPPLGKLPEVSHGSAVFETADQSDGDGASASSAPSSSSTEAPPAKRAFVLSRPPGHHCSGSTPSGFCWVNNVVVAAAHGYLQHKIDRVVIFDIDLHHGNGTQALAWRINADSQRHDLERDAQLDTLRASAVERNRAALKTGARGRQGAAAAVAASLVDERELEAQVEPRGLRIFYSSIHDIESFPCEDGDSDLIKNASVCVEGAHGQWIWNVHLDHYGDEDDFYRLYDARYSVLFSKAARFLSRTDAKPESTLVLISAGFDACSYEYPGMQRHGKHVPPSFYERFAQDSIQFSEQWAEGKVVSVLEGGYSDRALCSAAMAHVIGLAQVSSPSSGRREASSGGQADQAWKLENLVHLEKMAKKMAASAAAVTAGKSTPSTARRRGPEPPAWVSRSSRAFAAFERCCGKKEVYPLGHFPPAAAAQIRAKKPTSATAASSPGTTSGRVLRDRSALKQRTAWDPSSPSPSPWGSDATEGRGVASPKRAGKALPSARQPVSAVPIAAAAALLSRDVKVEQTLSSDSNFVLSSSTEAAPMQPPKQLETPHSAAIHPSTIAVDATSTADIPQVKREGAQDPAPAVAASQQNPWTGAARSTVSYGPAQEIASDAEPNQLTSRIGSVTPKAVDIQTTPVTLVDAMHNAFPSPSLLARPPSLPPSAPRDDAYRPGPSYVTGSSLTHADDGSWFADGLQQQRSSLGLVVPGTSNTPSVPGSLTPDGGSYHHSAPLALADDQKRSMVEVRTQQQDVPLDVEAMQLYKQQLAMQQMAIQQQYQQLHQPARLPPPPMALHQEHRAAQLQQPVASFQPGYSMVSHCAADHSGAAFPPAAGQPVRRGNLYPSLPPHQMASEDSQRQ